MKALTPKQYEEIIKTLIWSNIDKDNCSLNFGMRKIILANVKNTDSMKNIIDRFYQELLRE